MFLEANAFGKPVVATAVGGVPEAVARGESGLLVEPGDDKGLADAIVSLLNNPEGARRMGEYGRCRAELEFNWSDSAEQLLAIVHEAIELRK